jgi:hypothetical protein
MRSLSKEFALAFVGAGLLLILAHQALAAGLPTGTRVEGKTPGATSGYTLRSEMQLGGATAPEEAQFYEQASPADVGADADGNLYVLDSGGPRVQVFDAQGKFLRSLGKKGEGPGEFKMPGRIAVAADGRVAVFDMGLNRITILDSRGKLVRDQIVPTVVQDMQFDRQGGLVCAMAAPGGARIEAFDAQGKSRWNLAPEEAAERGRMLIMELGNETVGSRLAVGASALHFATRDEYGVRRIADGKVTHTWVRPFERQARQPLPQPREGDEEGGGTMVVIRRTEGGGSGDAAARTEVQSSAHGDAIQLDRAAIEKMMPKHRPDIRGLLAWPDGRLWVITAQDEGSTMVTDEWSADGTWRASFNLPRYDRLTVGADGKLYAVSHDQEEYAIVHRLAATPDNGSAAR